MTPAEHYREAEKLLEQTRAARELAAKAYDPWGQVMEAALVLGQRLTAQAAVHASLAAIPQEVRR